MPRAPVCCNAFLCDLHWCRSRGYLKGATFVATVAGNLCRAPRVATVRGAVIAALCRKAFAGWMFAFLHVCHACLPSNSWSNLRICTLRGSALQARCPLGDPDR